MTADDTDWHDEEQHEVSYDGGPDEVSAAVRRAIIQGRLGLAVEILQEASSQGHSLPHALVNLVLLKCLKRRDWTRALAIVTQTPGIQVCLTLYHDKTSPCVRYHCLPFHIILCCVKVNAVGFTMAIKACGRAKKWNEVSLWCIM